MIKKMIKKINILYSKETIWWSIDDNETKGNNEDITFEDLLKIVPNEEERIKLMKELKDLNEDKKQEIKHFYETELKPALKDLKEHLLNSEFYKKAMEKIKELKDKIRDIRNKKEKTPEDEKNKRTMLVQAALLETLKNSNLKNTSEIA